MRTLFIALLIPGMILPMGCATVTGTVTGAFTGMVDAPAEVYRHNRVYFAENPMMYGANVVFVGTVGLLTGPIVGFFKGVSLDVQWMMGHVSYSDAFGTYGPASIWRPFTCFWPTTPETLGDEEQDR